MTHATIPDQIRPDELVRLALDAGAAAMDVYNSDFDATLKADASPVTHADRRGEAIILAGLAAMAPNIPVLAEEKAADGDIPDDLGEIFFLVDPLDGTREFLSRTGEFTVNIALIRRGRPVYGVVYAPAIRMLYAGGPDGAWRAAVNDIGGLGGGGLGDKQKISARSAPQNGLVAVASRSHRSPETDAYLNTLTVSDFTAAGSSLKFCLLAEGKADIYPRFGRTMEWDTAAGQAVLEAAGGCVMAHPEGSPLAYGKKSRGYDNPHFIAWGRR